LFTPEVFFWGFLQIARFFYSMKSFLVLKNIGLRSALIAFIFLTSRPGITPASEYDDIEIIKSDREGVTLRYLVPEYVHRKVELLGKSYDLLNVDKCGLSNLPGKPQVPVRRVVIAIPLKAAVSMQILEQKQAEISGINLAYAHGVEPDETDPVGFKPTLSAPVFKSNSYLPKEVVSLGSPTFLRNQRIVELEIFPVQYNPVQRRVRYTEEITVSVSFSGGDPGRMRSEKDLFERIYQNVLFNYEQSKGWRRVGEEQQLFESTIPYPFGYSENWYKLIIWETGIYRIDRTMLIEAGVPVSSLDPKTLRIFSGGGRALPLDNSNPFLELKEMAISVSGEEDGSFDSEDYILFFAWSTNDWEYDSVGKATGFHTNPFTNDNVFWLTFNPSSTFPQSPKRMEVKSGDLGEQDPFIPQKFRSRVHMEQDNTLREYSSGYLVNYSNWYWMETSSAQMLVSLPGALPLDTALIKVKYTDVNPNIFVNGEAAEVLDSLSFNYIRVARSLNLHGGLVDTIDFSFPGNAFLDWYEIEYPRRFECHDRKLFFEGPEYSGVVRFEISDLYSSQAYLFDITDYYEVRTFDGVTIEGQVASFQDQIQTDIKNRYLLLDESRIKKPSEFFKDQNSDLRDISSHQADFLIITHSDFYDQLQDLKSFRESFNQISVRVVKVQDIYDEFSGGLLDPVAIRDFLKFAYQNWKRPAPAFALLVGDGNYDFKNNRGMGAVNYIPPFTPTWEGDRSVSDENYVYFGRYGYLDSDTAGTPQIRALDMVIGRWPVRTEDEAAGVLDKVTGYEGDPEFGFWRSMITLVADDEFTRTSSSEAIHTQDTEDLANLHVPSRFNKSKIYLMEYPFDFKGEKPEAEEAIVDAFNSGTLIINYMGHGNPKVWSHEQVFKRSQDIPRLNNQRKLPLVYTASCSIGLFFDPFGWGEGMAEELLRKEGKGAIATISATWLVFPDPNADLNDLVYDLLLNQDSLSVGEALFIAKLFRQPNDNDRQFVLFGDPVLKLGIPRLEVELTEVSPDTLSALSIINIRGEVKNDEGEVMTSLNGVAKVSAFDSQRERLHTMPNGGNVRYHLPGLIMFRGDAEVKGGRFQTSFVVPKDISYGGSSARISAYVVSEDQDGLGVRDSLVIGGSDTTVIDTTGPEISLSFDDRLDFIDGETILPNATLRLAISDEHGINITGEVGHGITLVIDEDFTNQIDLTDYFEYAKGSYQQGSLSHQLPYLSEGQHNLSIKAWDNANNSSLIWAKVQVSAQRELEISQVMNYPNPFSQETNFYYHLSQDADRVEIKIFTLAGKMIRCISFSSSQAGVNFSTTWDGRDEEGDEVANGVYIYKIIAECTVNGDRKKKEAFGKAVVVR
jgi:hypothetical protein